MTASKLKELVQESIRLEQNSAALYHLFQSTCPEDSDFWWQLHLEEKSHAMLLRAALDSFVNRGKYPGDLIADSLETLNADNTRLETLITHYTDHPPSRIECFHIAIEIESTVGESHYDLFMNKKADTPVEAAFQQLNRADKRHELRIRERLATVTALN